MLLRRVQPWFVNVRKRLIKTPRLFIRDSGVVHALLNLRSLDDLLGHPVAGASWEGFVVENLIGVAPRGTDAFFYRTRAGAEIDLLLHLAKLGVVGRRGEAVHQRRGCRRGSESRPTTSRPPAASLSIRARTPTL